MTGQLVSVNETQLYVIDRGSGPCNLLFLHGGGQTATDWNSVIDRLDGEARCIAYDRDGHGRSDRSGSRRPSVLLHDLLRTLEVQGPVVLVAHSLGGLHARAYQAKYGAEVSGMVLIEANSEFMMDNLAPAARRRASVALTASRLATWLGISHRMFAKALRSGDGLPSWYAALEEGQRREYAAMVPHLRKHLLAANAESRNIGRLLDEVRGRTLGSLPLRVVVSKSGNAMPADRRTLWEASQRRLAELSTNGQLVIAPTTEHFPHVVDPDWTAHVVRLVLARDSRP